MAMHRSYPDLRRRSRRGRNYFGDGSLGDVVISADTSLAAAQDGDMAVFNYKTLTINADKLLTTANRCRGALIYVQGNCVVNGKLSMTARGGRANPADAAVTANTPVAPSDGHAVPATGLVIRRLAQGQTGSHGDPLMYGCGAAAVAAEANQPSVAGDGLVITIPRAGGAGAPGASGVGQNGVTGGTAAAPGGGGSGGGYYGGDGAAATCFGGGSGGGGDGATAQAGDGAAYCGAGGAGRDNGDQHSGGGAGNPGGLGGVNGLGDTTTASGADGVGGLLILIVGGALSGSGVIESGGGSGGGLAGQGAGGGGSGGGAVVVLHAGNNTFSGSISANGGAGGPGTYTGGAGGAGAVIGPHKIDPA